MIYQYNKLVRDKIPSQINAIEGRKATWRTLKDDEYVAELDKKLLEESHEFIEAHSVEELGDLMEVIEAIMEFHKIQKNEVMEKQELKRNKKGGFRDKVYLEYVEENERNVKEEQELNKSWRKNKIGYTRIKK